MGIQVLRDQKLWLSGLDMTGVMNAMALNYGAQLVDTTVFGDQTAQPNAGSEDHIGCPHGAENLPRGGQPACNLKFAEQPIKPKIRQADREIPR